MSTHATRGNATLRLTGARWVGRAALARSRPEAEFLNWDGPSMVARWRDPEHLFGFMKNLCVVLDEIYHLPNPRRFWKITAD